MALITEDGTGKSNAESYISVADADTYHSNRGNAAWAALDTATKESCLRKATDYMIGTYRSKWLGRRVLITQSLDWPRVGVILEDFGNVQFGAYGFFQVSYQIVPTEVKNACAELALKAFSAELLADQKQKIIEKTVGPIKVKYDPYAGQAVIYAQVHAILRVYLASRGNNNIAKLLRS